jgi:hypothetical protein
MVHQKMVWGDCLTSKVSYGLLMERIGAPINIGTPITAYILRRRLTARVKPAFIRAITVRSKFIHVAIEIDGPVHCAVECFRATIGIFPAAAKKRVAFIKFGPAIINPIVARTEKFFANTRRAHREVTW